MYIILFLDFDDNESIGAYQKSLFTRETYQAFSFKSFTIYHQYSIRTDDNEHDHKTKSFIVVTKCQNINTKPINLDTVMTQSLLYSEYYHVKPTDLSKSL